MKHAAGHLAKAGTSAIGSFVRAWLYAMGTIGALAGTLGGLAVYHSAIMDHEMWPMALAVARGIALGGIAAFMLAVPAAVAVAIAWVALKW